MHGAPFPSSDEQDGGARRLSSRARRGELVHAPDPPLEARIPTAERHRIAEDLVEAVLVALLPDDRVLEEGKRDHVRDGQLVAEEEVAPGEERLEERQRICDPLRELRDPLPARLRLLLLGGDQVRRPLPDVVEPVDEDPHLCAPCLVGREERRLGVPRLEVLEDRRRVGEDEVAVDEDGHELLPADRDNWASVAVIDVDVLDRDPLVRERERDALDVGRERNPIEPQTHRESLCGLVVVAASPGAAVAPGVAARAAPPAAAAGVVVTRLGTCAGGRLRLGPRLSLRSRCAPSSSPSSSPPGAQVREQARAGPPAARSCSA